MYSCFVSVHLFSLSTLNQTAAMWLAEPLLVHEGRRQWIHCSLSHLKATFLDCCKCRNPARIRPSTQKRPLVKPRTWTQPLLAVRLTILHHLEAGIRLERSDNEVHQICQQVIRLHCETKPACLLDQPVQTQRCWEVTEHAETRDVMVGEKNEGEFGHSESSCFALCKILVDEN